MNGHKRDSSYDSHNLFSIAVSSILRRGTFAVPTTSPPLSTSIWRSAALGSAFRISLNAKKTAAEIEIIKDKYIINS
jgi:hypothetical protein